MKKVFFHLEGICARRQLDISKVRSYLESNGHLLTDRIEDSDAVFFFGCSFNTFREEEGLRVLGEMKHQDIYVIEGLAKTSGEKLRKMGFSDDRIIPLENLSMLDKDFAVDTLFAEADEQNQFFSSSGSFSVMVARGCADTCTYCGDKIIVGDIVSKSLPEILAEINKGLDSGYGYINLVGDDVGAYGSDIGLTVFDLLEAVAGIERKFNVNIFELNIKYLARDMERLEKFLSKKMLTSMVVAFQSGSSRVLNLMNRGYAKEDILNVVGALVRNRIHFHYHVLVGFPSETEKDFDDTLDILKTYQFYSASLFIYQEREYTKAVDIQPKVDHETVMKRIMKAQEVLADGYSFVLKPDKLSISAKN